MQSTLSPQQIVLIRSTLPALKEHGNTITQLFYRSLLDDYPALKNVFNKANQDNNHQPASLASVLFAYAANIANPVVLTAALEKINHKHASLFVQPEQYDLVGKYLLQAFADVLGDNLTVEIHDAWAAAYNQLASFMIKMEKRLKGAHIGGWAEWRDFEIVQKVEESEEITSFYLRPHQPQRSASKQWDGEVENSCPLPAYIPGQYISVQVHVPELDCLQSRQYSLSDEYNESTYRISVKKDLGLSNDEGSNTTPPGQVSNVLHNETDIGSIVQVSHPHGEFGLKPTHTGPVVLLAAGVGITPMISMLKTLCSKRSTQSISLVHGARTTKTRAFSDEIRRLARLSKNVRYASFVTASGLNEDDNVQSRDYDFEGRIQLGVLDAKEWLFLDDTTTEYYICGPDSFMADMASELMEKRVDEDRIHVEAFGVTVV